MRNIKCPFCNEELEPIIGACEDTEYYCQNCDYMTGDENLWNQLTKYKQALGIAKNAMHSAVDHNIINCMVRDIDPRTDDTNVTLCNALEQITALEQKDVK